MSLSYSAPLYLFFDVVVPPFHDDDDEFEFAAAGAKNVEHEDEDDSGGAPRACASDLSALADELFRGAGVLLPLKLPPRLQHPAGADFSSSAATSPTAAHVLGRVPSSWSPFPSSRRQHRGFDPFAAALEKVRRDDGAAATCLSCSRSRHAGAGSTTATAQQKATGRLDAGGTAARLTGGRVSWSALGSKRESKVVLEL